MNNAENLLTKETNGKQVQKPKGFRLPPVTEESLNEGRRIWMDALRRNPNNFSFWFPLVKDLRIPGLMIPKSVIIDCPEEVMMSFFMEKEGDGQRIDLWVQDYVIPVIKEHFPSGDVFIKNGCFSDKYVFGKACHVKDSSDVKQLISHIFRIQSDSLCVESYGNLEMVVREYIPAVPGTPTIYHGMPLRPEIRVFYDFDYHQYLYAVNYWQWEECHDYICSHPEDAMVYQMKYPKLNQRTADLLIRHMERICRTMDSVEGLTGIWSVDFILEDDRIWLIDMAQGYRSTYWDKEKIIRMFPNRYA